ncbi:MAG: radical SAM family heme chaperone HemW [Gammaproteobacteria bacterium]
MKRRTEAALKRSLQTAPPLSLYVHFPWCVRKCPYCDFNSHEFGETFPEADYINALIRDLDANLDRIKGREVISIFMGGGTPSLFSAEELSRLLSVINAGVVLSKDAEITLEANPGTAEADRFHGYRRAGINRLSIGVQSLDDEKLKALGRIHGAREAEYAVSLARQAGFDNLNIDIMYGLPGQDAAAALKDIAGAVALRPEHLSWYQLTIEPNTVFYKHTPVLPDDEETWNMQQQGRAMLEAHGYSQYEISAWARAGREARHNLNYWEFGDYLGIGAGAHSKLTDAASGDIVRSARHKLPGRYLELAGGREVVTSERMLDEGDRILEFMMNALRLPQGFPAGLFEDRTGLALEAIRDRLDEAVAKDLLDAGNDRIRPTARGAQFLNNLLELFQTGNVEEDRTPFPQDTAV